MKTIKTLVMTGLVTFGVCFTTFAANTAYSISEVPACAEGPFGIGGLTDHGAIAGSCQYSDAFLSNRRGVQIFAPAPGELLYVRGMNRREQLVGYSESSGPNRAILLQTLHHDPIQVAAQEVDEFLDRVWRTRLLVGSPAFRRSGSSLLSSRQAGRGLAA